MKGMQQTLTGSKISTSSTKFLFFGPTGKTKWPTWPLIGWDIFDFSSETVEWYSMKLGRKQDPNVLYKVFFGPIGKTRWPPWPLIGGDNFDFSSETAERNSTKLDVKQDLIILYQVFSGQSKKKMAALSSDWLRHFRLLLWNGWMEFYETWQEARSQRPLPSLCFTGRSEKQDGCPGLWLAEKFSTSPLKLLIGIQRNLTGSKISTSSTKFVFFRAVQKKNWPPRSYWLRHFQIFFWNCWTELNKTWHEARSQRPLPSLCFGDWLVYKMATLANPSKSCTLYSGASYVALLTPCLGFMSPQQSFRNLKAGDTQSLKLQ